MRILFAAADRDLLRCYQKILGEAVGETVTVFDGTQVLTLTAEESFDVVVLDRHIPRVDYRHILQRLENAGTPVIVLQSEPVSSQLLMSEPLASAYLPYPFRTEALIAAVRDVTAKRASGELLSFADAEADVSSFRLRGGARLTAPELDLLRGLIGGHTPDTARIGVYVGAVNGKLLKQNSRARIRYWAGEGYQLVMQDE